MGFVGAVASLFSLPIEVLGIILFWISQKERKLTFQVHPEITTIVKADQASNLRVFHDNVEVKSDVTAVRLSLWNAGKLAIRPEHVLEPVVISLPPPGRILEAKIVRVSRRVCSIEIDQSGFRQGKVGVDWKILEHEDGFALQIIASSNLNQSIEISGSVEGQPNIFVVDRVNGASTAVVGVLALMFGCFFAFFAGSMVWFQIKNPGVAWVYPRVARWTPLVTGVLAVLLLSIFALSVPRYIGVARQSPFLEAPSRPLGPPGDRP
ncbi:MAG: hypothetical protein KIT09_18210 [Bryobacteraceae bacterium]|nr:hypothetical protein [Bryobacteraceae bacterium]